MAPLILGNPQIVCFFFFPLGALGPLALACWSESRRKNDCMPGSGQEGGESEQSNFYETQTFLPYMSHSLNS